MKLSVSWINATRPPEVRTQVELSYRNRLLDFCDGVENAKRCHDNFIRASRHGLHDWQRFNYYAHTEATELLTPTEKKLSKFKIEFTPSD